MPKVSKKDHVCPDAFFLKAFIDQPKTHITSFEVDFSAKSEKFRSSEIKKGKTDLKLEESEI